MRIPIREQLAALVLLSTLIGLAVIAVATWITNHNLVIGLRSSTLQVTASLKSAQLASNMALYERISRGLTTRYTLQGALVRYNQGNDSNDNWSDFIVDYQTSAAAQQQPLSLQTIIYPPNNLIGGNTNGLVKATNPSIHIELPYKYPNGSAVLFGNPDRGYPPNLYPNLTYTDHGHNTSTPLFNNMPLNNKSTILLGPWQLNESYALFSVTVPVINNTSHVQIIGWTTLVMSAQLIFGVLKSPVGLDQTGTVLLLAPDTLDNRFHHDELHGKGEPTTNAKVHFVLPPDESRYKPHRHSLRDYGGPDVDKPFPLSSYSSVAQGLTSSRGDINNAGSDISSQNEQGEQVSIGFAVPRTDLCQWILIVEEAKSEAFQSILSLRNILLACVFGTAGGMVLLIYPLAYYSSRPIRRLRDATRGSVVPVPSSPNADSAYGQPEASFANGRIYSPKKDGMVSTVDEKNSPRSSWGRFWKAKKPHVDVESPMTLQSIRVPGKVPDRKHLIEDELTDLTQTFNEMSDELFLQYSKLEERVRQRTAELEVSKKAAEAANESKTLFIANISHELKTPLNGILGMCAVCMQEDDLAKIKRSLGIIYKSGDLLHHLLTDLLTFSKNQAGKHLSLEEKEFRLRDVGAQLHAIFQTQASERRTSFSITYHGPCNALGAPRPIENGEYGPAGSGKVRDMCLWGDIQRILQVAINLISNSLKFTPSGGNVQLRIRCVEKALQPLPPLSRQASVKSNESEKQPQGSIDGKGGGKEMRSLSGPEFGIRERASFASASSDNPAQAPPDADTFWFEFEVLDNGPGVSKALQSRIFEPFVQGDLRLTKKFGGTGLGLSICSQLAKLLRGDINLESTVDIGSKFTLRVPLKLCRTRADSTATSVAHGSVASLETSLLPTNKEDSTPSSGSKAFESDTNPRLIGLSQPYFSSANPPLASPSSETQKRENKLKVLVAEDNKVNQEVVLRMLRLEEIFDVHVARDGQEALDFVKASMELESPYDLIFMDIMMPNLDGRQSTRLIRQIGYSAPIVALTAFADEVNQKECMDSGMDYFLSKPIKRPALKHVLKTYCAPIQEMDETDNRDGDEFTNKDPFKASMEEPERPKREESPVVTPRTTLE